MFFNINKYENIIWDWNGTILDDVGLSVKTVNDLLIRRGRSPTDKVEYLNQFEIPIINYYKKMNFDFEKESFDDICNEYYDLYKKNILSVTLCEGSAKCIKRFAELRLNQIILSSHERDSLIDYVNLFGLGEYFSEILGLEGKEGKGKLDLAEDWVKRNKIDSNKTLIIGDLVSDYYVAEGLGIDCILVSSGYQRFEMLKKCKALVLKSLNELYDTLKGD